MNTLPRPKLLMITGLPGTGKTTVASALAKRLQAEHFNTDMIRQEMGLRGQYDPETKEQVYSILLERTREALAAGKTVVVDGTFYRSKLRDEFRQQLNAQLIPIYWLELWAEDELIRKRVSKARAYSEADFEIYLKIKATYEPILEPHLRLESKDANLEQLVEEIILHLSKP